MDESIQNTAPAMDVSKPEAKEEEFDPIAPNLIITPKISKNQLKNSKKKFEF